jgi:hypothetical protein
MVVIPAVGRDLEYIIHLSEGGDLPGPLRQIDIFLNPTAILSISPQPNLPWPTGPTPFLTNETAESRWHRVFGEEDALEAIPIEYQSPPKMPPKKAKSAGEGGGAHYTRSSQKVKKTPARKATPELGETVTMIAGNKTYTFGGDGIPVESSASTLTNIDDANPVTVDPATMGSENQTMSLKAKGKQPAPRRSTVASTGSPLPKRKVATATTPESQPNIQAMHPPQALASGGPPFFPLTTSKPTNTPPQSTTAPFLSEPKKDGTQLNRVPKRPRTNGDDSGDVFALPSDDGKSSGTALTTTLNAPLPGPAQSAATATLNAPLPRPAQWRPLPLHDDRQTGAALDMNGLELAGDHIRGIEGTHGAKRDFPLWTTKMDTVMQGLKDLGSGEQLTLGHLENMHVMAYPGDRFFNQPVSVIKKQWPQGVLLTDEVLVLALFYFTDGELKTRFPGDFGSDGKVRQIRWRFGVPPKVLHKGETYYLVYRNYYTFVGVEITGGAAWNVLGNKRTGASGKKTVSLSFGSCPVAPKHIRFRGNVWFEQNSKNWEEFQAGGSPGYNSSQPDWRRVSQEPALRPVYISREDATKHVKDETTTTPAKDKAPKTKAKGSAKKTDSTPVEDDSWLLKSMDQGDDLMGETHSALVLAWAEAELNAAIAKLPDQRGAIRAMQQQLDNMVANQEPFVTAERILNLAVSFDKDHLQNLVKRKLQRLFDKDFNPPSLKLGAAQLQKLTDKFPEMGDVKTQQAIIEFTPAEDLAEETEDPAMDTTAITTASRVKRGLPSPELSGRPTAIRRLNPGWRDLLTAEYQSEMTDEQLKEIQQVAKQEGLFAQGMDKQWKDWQNNPMHTGVLTVTTDTGECYIHFDHAGDVLRPDGPIDPSMLDWEKLPVAYQTAAGVAGAYEEDFTGDNPAYGFVRTNGKIRVESRIPQAATPQTAITQAAEQALVVDPAPAIQTTQPALTTKYPRYMQRLSGDFAVQLWAGGEWITTKNLPPGVTPEREQAPKVHTYPRYLMRWDGLRQFQLYEGGEWLPTNDFPPGTIPEQQGNVPESWEVLESDSD